MPAKGNKCCCGGSASPSHSPSSSPSSSPSASPEPPIIIPDCGDAAQYQFTVSGLTNRTLNCSGFNRTWTLSKAVSTFIVQNPEWNEVAPDGKHAVIYYDEPYHILVLGPHGIYVGTAWYLLTGDWNCTVGGTNVFTQGTIFDGCFNWPATITVTRIV